METGMKALEEETAVDPDELGEKEGVEVEVDVMDIRYSMAVKLAHEIYGKNFTTVMYAAIYAHACMANRVEKQDRVVLFEQVYDAIRLAVTQAEDLGKAASMTKDGNLPRRN